CDDRGRRSAPSLPPQGGDLAEHPDAIARDVDLASLVMVPAHRDFFHPEVRFPGQIEQLNVETEAIGLGGFKNWPENIEAECFEAALRVPIGQAGREPHDQIEDAAALLAAPWLAMTDEAAIQGARPKGYGE